MSEKDPGFVWWHIWGWLGLLVGVPLLVMVGLSADRFNGWYLGWAAINGFVHIFVLQFSRSAFLFSTIASLNPLVWIINGIYLRNRWRHPRVLAGSGIDALASKPEELKGKVPTHSLPHGAADQTTPRVTEGPGSGEVTLPGTPATPSTGSGRPLASPADHHYRVAAEEVDAGLYDKGLWERLFSESDGDLAKTRARYIGRRALQLCAAEQASRS
jgi:hypothetical protein